MRLLLFLSTLLGIALAWSAADHEIFRLHHEVLTAEGANATFYSLLSVPKRATSDAIARAYRRAGLTLHPDKARANFLSSTPKPSQREVKAFQKRAEERWARIGLVAEVLRSERRARYDHFLDNGFPAWRGTGWAYTRFRPGLGSTLLGLWVVLAGGAHYLALYMGWKKRREFVVRYIEGARRAAGQEVASAVAGIVAADSPAGSESEGGQAQQWNRREKRAAMKEKKRKIPLKKGREGREAISTPVEASVTSGPVGAKKRTVAENGKVLIVDSAGNVWLEEDTEEGETHEFLLDPDEIQAPTVYDTAMVKLPLWVYAKAKSRITGEGADDVILFDDDDRPEDEQAVEAATAINRNADMRKRKAKIHPRKL